MAVQIGGEQPVQEATDCPAMAENPEVDTIMDSNTAKHGQCHSRRSFVTAGPIIPAMSGSAPDSEQLRALRGALTLLAEDPPLELGSCALARRLLPAVGPPTGCNA